jgi:PadR family transcriptional regulator, regulatory protein PadR
LRGRQHHASGRGIFTAACFINHRTNSRMTDKDLFSGMVRLHVLHHADEGPIFGLAIIEELRRHGYQISAGTMYPILHGLERKGYLASRNERRDGRERRIYRITPLGHRALDVGRTKVRELFGELIEGRPHRRKTNRPSVR